MRQVHRAGEKLFVDYSGKKPHICRPDDRRAASRSSSSSRCSARRTTPTPRRRARSRCPTGSASHARALRVLRRRHRRSVVPDQLKSGVTRAVPLRARDPAHVRGDGRSTTARRCCRRGPASRATRPRSRSAVLVAQRWILARLRNQTFFSLDELNARDRRAARGAQRPPDARATGRAAGELFERLDRPALKPLPAARFVYGEWKNVQGEHRLPRRGRPPLLLGAVPRSCTSAARGAR